MVNATLQPLYPQKRPSTHCIGGWVGPRASLDRCKTLIKQDIKLFLKLYKNYPCGMCRMFNSDIPGMLEAVHIEFWEHQLGPPPAIWSLWVADCCVYVWVLSAANGTLWVLSAANWTMWVVINVSVCAVHMGSSRRSHGSCITITSTTGLTMTRKDPGVTYSWKRGKRKVNSLLCCQVEEHVCKQFLAIYSPVPIKLWDRTMKQADYSLYFPVTSILITSQGWTRMTQ